MTPEDITRHTADVRALLKDASYKRLEIKQGGFDPYTPGPPVQQTPGPMTFVWTFAWTKHAEQQRLGWEALMQGFKLAMGAVYPECSIAHYPVKLEDYRMLSLVFSQVYAKMRRSLRGPLVYIEADVVCNRRCDPFESEFDIGLCDTDEQWPMMPFNPGVMFARETPEAQLFLDTAMEYTCHFPQNADPWYLYQFGLSHAYLVLKDKVNIKIFPNEEYNYSPTVYAPTDAYFVHLKGERKKMQRDYVLPLLEAQSGGKVILLPNA